MKNLFSSLGLALVALAIGCAPIEREVEKSSPATGTGNPPTEASQEPDGDSDAVKKAQEDVLEIAKTGHGSVSSVIEGMSSEDKAKVLNHKDENGNTPAMVALLNGKIETLRQFTNQPETEYQAENSEGRTVDEMAKIIADTKKTEEAQINYETVEEIFSLQRYLEHWSAKAGLDVVGMQPTMFSGDDSKAVSNIKDSYDKMLGLAKKSNDFPQKLMRFDGALEILDTLEGRMKYEISVYDEVLSTSQAFQRHMKFHEPETTISSRMDMTDLEIDMKSNIKSLELDIENLGSNEREELQSLIDETRASMTASEIAEYEKLKKEKAEN